MLLRCLSQLTYEPSKPRFTARASRTDTRSRSGLPGPRLSAHAAGQGWSVFLFAAGAAAAYGLLRFLTRRAEGEAQSQLTRSPHLARAGAIDVGAIALSVGAAALIARITGDVAWAVAPFAQALLYLGVSCVEMALLERGHAAPTPGG